MTIEILIPTVIPPSSDDNSDEIEDYHPVDFTIDDVPNEIQGICLVGLLHVEILRAGEMMSTGDEVQDRANALKIKNHVAYWAYIHPADATNERSTIRLSMNVMNPNASFGSTDARYAPSDHSSFSSFSSTFSTSGKPTSPGSAPPSIPSGNSSSVPGGSSSSRDAASVFSSSQLITMLPDGVPAKGRFDIKIHDYSGKSNSAVTSFCLRIIGEPTLGQFLNSLRVRHMLPFYFPKKGFSYLSCRHFASEAVEAWKQDEYIMDHCMITGSFFCDLIGVRYTPLRGLPISPMASSEEGGSEDESSEKVLSGMRKTPNPIDKGIFPSEFQSLTAGYPFTL
ncbi:unnamed protein product [Cyclocybe aegerita]|uniref:Uncharacterized protein n=1 Tax=Cyclocybe aegerita TaxID=1973307 RepID=A0A8S0XQ39_CYCAE|nr:unnamed protein product [Cyclocybe aegerita]